jgi:PTS system ascorbate-specific IIA component
MAVAVLLVTHGGIGEELLASATRILGSRPLPCAAFAVELNSDPERVASDLATQVARLDQGDGVLLLIDLFGATPGNVACRIADAPPYAVVTGVNLPMLLKVFNYPALDLDALADKACDGGRSGVLRVSDLHP